jgi:FtsZ-binding cell division protein ZapB
VSVEAQLETLNATIGAMQSAAHQIATLQRKVNELTSENLRLREMQILREENKRLRAVAEYLKENWTCTSSFAPGCEHMCKCPQCLAARALSDSVDG